jgi:hypothetical protein
MFHGHSTPNLILTLALIIACFFVYAWARANCRRF